MNQNNKRHVDKVWGKHGKVHVWIPKNNHWIFGVDLADQKISYYNPDICCQISLVLVFVQLLSMTRLNSYIFYVSHYFKNKDYKPVITHKSF